VAGGTQWLPDQNHEAPQEPDKRVEVFAAELLRPPRLKLFDYAARHPVYFPATLSASDQDCPAVFGVGPALHIAPLLEVIDQLGHRLPGHS
jgi:hypothetical protein